MDGPGLERFARQMQICELTLDKMGWSEDLNNGETLLRTVDRLPQFMQFQWAEKAESILKMGKRLQFNLCKIKPMLQRVCLGSILLNQDENLLKNHRNLQIM